MRLLVWPGYCGPATVCTEHQRLQCTALLAAVAKVYGSALSKDSTGQRRSLYAGCSIAYTGRICARNSAMKSQIACPLVDRGFRSPECPLRRMLLWPSLPFHAADGDHQHGRIGSDCSWGEQSSVQRLNCAQKYLQLGTD